jgi:hypothetical protein
MCLFNQPYSNNTAPILPVSYPQPLKLPKIALSLYNTSIPPAMKNLLLFIAGLLLFGACSNLTEEIIVKKDGSGEYLIYTDLVPSMGGMMRGFMAMTAGDSLSEADIDERVKEMIWKDFGHAVDSVFTLNDKIPDSLQITDLQRQLIPKIQGFMKGTKEAGYIHSGMKFGFSNAQELQALTALMEESQQTENAGMGKSQSKIEVTKTSISRSTSYTERPDFENSMEAQMMPGKSLLDFENFCSIIIF